MNLTAVIFDKTLSRHPLWGKLMYVLQLGTRLVWDVREGQLTLRAMSLVYTTLLSFVPLLALSFSVLKGFGVHNQIEPFLMNFLDPLGDKGHQIAAQIIGFVENMKVGVLGAIGLGFLIYTVISLIQKIESSFNYIWHVESTRPLAQRFSGYLSVTIMGPVLIFAAVGLSSAVLENPLVTRFTDIGAIGTTVEWVSSIMPFIFQSILFSFLYILIPNTRVKFRHAIVAGALATLVWKLVGWVFASFVASSSNYDVIYSGFAAILIFMLWLYANWTILLLGASLNYYLQNPKAVTLNKEPEQPAPGVLHNVAFELMDIITRDFEKGRPSTVEALTEQTGHRQKLVHHVLCHLKDAGLLNFLDQQEAFTPAKPINKITSFDVWQAVEGNIPAKSQHPDYKSVVAKLKKGLK